MKRIVPILTLVLAAGAGAAQAQSSEVPKHKCEPKPEYPGRLIMQSETRRKGFERELKDYQKCMTTYLEERKAAMKQNEENANAAVNEYNETMKTINAAQEAAKQ